MITEEAYIAYFENLAARHLEINHVPGSTSAFFYIPVPMNLTEIDNAITSSKSTPLLALDALNGAFDSKQSASYLQTVQGQFFILDKVKVGNSATIRDAQDKCLKIGMDILARMEVDTKGSAPIARGARFVYSNVQYNPVGPMASNHYGYTFRFTVTCPFGYTVNSAIWQDK